MCALVDYWPHLRVPLVEHRKLYRESHTEVLIRINTTRMSEEQNALALIGCLVYNAHYFEHSIIQVNQMMYSLVSSESSRCCIWRLVPIMMMLMLMMISKLTYCFRAPDDTQIMRYYLVLYTSCSSC